MISAVGVLAMAAGLALIWSAVADESPTDLFVATVTGSTIGAGAGGAIGSAIAGTPPAPPFVPNPQPGP